MTPLAQDIPPITARLTSEAQTARLAATLAPCLRPADVVLLSGPLGAGKSAFARAMIQAAQAEAGAEPEDVPSPSYTLMQTYTAGDRTFVHADLYRLTSPDEIIELGLDEAMQDSICLIEWPERLGPDRPERAIHLTLEPLIETGAEDMREISLRTCGTGWAQLVQAATEVLA